MKSELFGHSPAGEPVYLFTLRNQRGMSARITNYGGIVTHLFVPDQQGRTADVVLGFDTLEPYLQGHPYFGAIVGRIAGRLSGGRFPIDGTIYAVSQNENDNHLHGGFCALDKKIWDPSPIDTPEGESLRLTCHSPDGEEGYPGNVRISVTYTLSPDNALIIDYTGSTDQATPLSLTHHGYFNLRGESSGNINGHQIQILADKYTSVNADFSHTGEICDVVAGANDFRRPATVGSRLDSLFGRHGDTYLLNPPDNQPTLAARVHELESGRTMEVLTTERCLQFYTGVNLDGSVIGKSGQPYRACAGFCIECQGHSDAPNHPHLAPIILYPCSEYQQRTVYRFS